MSVSHSTYEIEAPPKTKNSREPLPVPEQRGFYRQFGKRALDLFLSLFALLVLSPLFLLIAIVVKLTSPGPVLYRQNRVGRDARIFQIMKFRSMVTDADQNGCGITIGGDERVTPFGRILRNLKLDELPQLWNVLRGDMSIVGPRPEIPSYVAGYTREQLLVLAVRPGITDVASIRYRHEERVLARSSNPEEFYRGVVLPHKLSLNLQYIDGISFASDVKLILQTARSIFV